MYDIYLGGRNDRPNILCIYSSVDTDCVEKECHSDPNMTLRVSMAHRCPDEAGNQKPFFDYCVKQGVTREEFSCEFFSRYIRSFINLSNVVSQIRRVMLANPRDKDYYGLDIRQVDLILATGTDCPWVEGKMDYQPTTKIIATPGVRATSVLLGGSEGSQATSNAVVANLFGGISFVGIGIGAILSIVF